MSEALHQITPVYKRESTQLIQARFEEALRKITADGNTIIVRRMGQLVLVDGELNEVTTPEL